VRFAPGLGGAEVCLRAGSTRDAGVFVRRRQAHFPFMQAMDEAGHYCVEGSGEGRSLAPRLRQFRSPPLISW
jgi:hypothetical protein